MRDRGGRGGRGGAESGAEGRGGAGRGGRSRIRGSTRRRRGCARRRSRARQRHDALRARLLAQRSHLAFYDGEQERLDVLSAEALDLARTSGDDPRPGGCAACSAGGLPGSGGSRRAVGARDRDARAGPADEQRPCGDVGRALATRRADRERPARRRRRGTPRAATSRSSGSADRSARGTTTASPPVSPRPAAGTTRPPRSGGGDSTECGRSNLRRPPVPTSRCRSRWPVTSASREEMRHVRPAAVRAAAPVRDDVPALPCVSCCSARAYPTRRGVVPAGRADRHLVAARVLRSARLTCTPPWRAAGLGRYDDLAVLLDTARSRSAANTRVGNGVATWARPSSRSDERRRGPRALGRRDRRPGHGGRAGRGRRGARVRRRGAVPPRLGAGRARRARRP